MIPYLYVAEMDIPQEHEDLFNRLYDNEHIPQLMEVEGVRSVQRYRLDHSSAEGTARYLAIYELDSPDVVKKPEWRTAADTGEWMPKIRPHTANRLHKMYTRIK